jgi:phosphoesterase RecJ-like protein
MEIDITPDIASALYTGILVDSGRFQYEATSAATFRVAADLIGRGVDHTDIFRRVYENMPLAKSKLLCHVLSSMRMLCDGRLAVGILDEAAFREAGAGAGLTEGLVDNLRAIEGVEVAALIYARLGEADGTAPHYRVSLRSAAGDDVNVQQIARLKGGGGHTQAAGFSADETPDQLVEFLVEAVGAALAASKQPRAL